jgi:hypothetical protein
MVVWRINPVEVWPAFYVFARQAVESGTRLARRGVAESSAIRTASAAGQQLQKGTSPRLAGAYTFWFPREAAKRSDAHLPPGSKL